MSDAPLLVSVGLPVFNGEAFLMEAADALLAQTYGDLELIISDNGSTDGTPRICEALAAKDPRVRVIRQAQNLGTVANFDAVFRAARGPLFKWAAHDDVHDPTFIERCVEALATNPHAVLAYTRADSLSAEGRVVRPDWGERPELSSTDVTVRFRAALAPQPNPLPLPMFGVMRREVLLRTGLLSPGPEFDLALLAELTLHGPFVEVADPLFGQREHHDRQGRKVASPTRDALRLLGRGSRLPTWGLLRRHLASIGRRPSSVPALPLFRALMVWAIGRRGSLASDLVVSLSTLPGVGRGVAAMLRWHRNWSWNQRIRATRRELDRLLPGTAHPIVVDDDALGVTSIGARECSPLGSEELGWGFPEDSESAIAHLESRRADGATHLAILFPAHWVLDYHGGFADHLSARHRLLRRSSNAVVYELRGADPRSVS